MAVTTAGRLRKNRGAAPLQSLFWRLPWLRSALLLVPPLAWFVLIYLASLVLLLITAFWTIDTFTTQIVQVWNLDNFRLILSEPAYRLIIGRTVGLAALVTLTDAVLAFPFAYFMARVASRRAQTILFAAVLLPLWASYLARVYSWILILNHSGLLNWSLQSIGLPPANIGYTYVAMWIVFSYIWLPFMIIPTYAAMERVPESLMEAAADLGARRARAVRDVVLPWLCLESLPARSSPSRLRWATTSLRFSSAARAPPSSATSSTATWASPTTSRSRRPLRRFPSRSWPCTSSGPSALARSRPFRSQFRWKASGPSWRCERGPS